MEMQTISDAILSDGLLTKGVTVLSTHCPLCRTHRQPILWMITAQRLYYLPRIKSGVIYVRSQHLASDSTLKSRRCEKRHV